MFHIQFPRKALDTLIAAATIGLSGVFMSAAGPATASQSEVSSNPTL